MPSTADVSTGSAVPPSAVSMPSEVNETLPGPGSVRLGLVLLAGALAFNAIFLAPELRGEALAWNDSTFHLAAAERLGQSLFRGEPFLDPWVSEMVAGLSGVAHVSATATSGCRRCAPPHRTVHVPCGRLRRRSSTRFSPAFQSPPTSAPGSWGWGHSAADWQPS